MVMTITLSMAAPPLLRAVARSWHGTDEEQTRLRREASLQRNVMVKPERLLLPSQGGPNSIVAAQLLHLVWPEGVRASVLTVGTDADRDGVQAVLDVFGERGADLIEVPDDDAAKAILHEARLGYGVIGLGAPTGREGSGIISPLVDALLTATPLPLVIVRRARDLDRRLPGAFARGVIAISPDAASRTAQEIGFGLSANIGTEMVLVHAVAEAPPGADGQGRRDGDGASAGPARNQRRPGGQGPAPSAVLTDPPDLDVAELVMAEAADLGAELDARVRTEIRPGASAADSILAAVEESGADLLIIGAELRRLEGRPFLGHKVEQLLASCPATVVVVATPTTKPAVSPRDEGAPSASAPST